jgi:hypothetical protein
MEQTRINFADALLDDLRKHLWSLFEWDKRYICYYR